MKFRGLMLTLACAALPTALSAQGAPAGLDGKQPIEINADSLEVRQQENIAVFSGNVIAIQDTTRLKSDVMTVHYKKKEGQTDSGDPTQGAVQRIIVEKNVMISTPDETASGDHGVYEVAKKQVNLTGNVVLTRGKNILKGDTLVYDFNTGKSVINSPFHSGEQGGAPKGRVRALFVPEKSQ